MVHWYEGSLVEKSRKGNIFYDVGAFCFVKAEFKLRRRVRHLRIDSEKAVLIKRRGYCEQRTDGETPLEEKLMLQKFHGVSSVHRMNWYYVRICMMCGLKSPAGPRSHLRTFKPVTLPTNDPSEQ